MKAKTIAIKALFSGKSSHGAFVLRIESESRKPESFTVAIKNGDELSKIDIYLPYARFEEILKTSFCSVEDQFAKVIQNLTPVFMNDMYPEKTEKIVNLITSPGDEYLKNILIRDLLTEELRKGFRELSGKVDIVVETVDSASSGKDNPSDASAGDSSAESITVKTKPVLDPVRGKKSSRLVLGDRMLVRFTDKNDLALHGKKVAFADPSHGNAEQICAEVTEIKEIPETGDVKILLRLGPGIFSVLTLQPELRINVISSENDELSSESARNSESSFQMIYVLSGMIGLLLLIILIMFLFQ